MDQIAGPPPAAYPQDTGSNPLQMMGQLAQTQNALNANAQFQQQFAARQALGPILQSSVNSDGELDYNKAFVKMSADPRTAWMAPDFLAQGIQKQAVQAETVLKSLDYHQKQQAGIYSAVQGLLPLGDQVTKGDIIRVATDLVNQGTLDKKEYTGFLQTLAGVPDKAASQFVKQVAFASRSADENLKAAAGGYDWHDTGNGLALIHSAPQMGQGPRLIGTMSKGLTPEQQASPVNQENDLGQKIMTPQGQFLQKNFGWGQGGAVPPGGNLTSAGAPSVGAPANGPAAEGASQTPPPNAGVGGGGPPTPPPTSPQGGPVTMAPSKERQDQLSQLGDYTKQMSTDSENAGHLLQNIIQAKQLIKEFKPGAGADFREEAARVIYALGGTKEDVNRMTGGGDSLASQQAFKSQMMDFALQRLKDAIKTGKITNLEFQNVLNAKPNPNMQEDAAMALLNTAERGANLARDQLHQYNKYMATPGADPIKFKNEIWPKEVDRYNTRMQEFFKKHGGLGKNG